MERFGRWIDTEVMEWVGRLMTLAMIPMLLFLIVAFTGITVVGIFKIFHWATH